MNTTKFNFDDIDWKDIILRLTAFADSFARSKHWFRGSQVDVFGQGKQANDYVLDAIERFLIEPGKYNPEKANLFDYLRYNVIRTLIGNDARSAENRNGSNAFTHADDLESESEGSSETFLEKILPMAVAYFDEELDYNKIMIEIEKQVSSDPITEKIFMGESLYGLKRAQIIKEFNMTPAEFDNGKRRLKTILNNVAKTFNLNQNDQ